MATYTVAVSGISIKPLNLTVDQLKSLFPHASVCASLQCGGNRRRDMSKEKATQGLQWASGAIGTAVWTGVKLRDVLRYAGLLEYSKGEVGTGKPQHVHVSTDRVRPAELGSVPPRTSHPGSSLTSQRSVRNTYKIRPFFHDLIGNTSSKAWTASVAPSISPKPATKKPMLSSLGQ